MTTAERTATIESLLGELDELRRRIYVSKAFGARAAGLRDLKSEFRSAQRRLAALAS